MIDIQQLTSLIPAFRVETEKSAGEREQRKFTYIAEREQIMQRKHLTRTFSFTDL